MGFKNLKRSEIEEALSSSTRQYLAGKLEKPQLLKFIEDFDLEVGISDYEIAQFEQAHVHAQAKEYQYVIKGMTEYLDVDTEEVHRFSIGDFYVIAPGTKYIQRIKQDTRILFFKFPGGNDKTEIAVTEDVAEWASQPLRVKRVDLRGKEAPQANSLVPAAAAAIFNSIEQILLIKRRDSGNWAMPGGTLEMNESLEDCILREVEEETGLPVEIKGLIRSYSDPDVKICYSDGEVRREFSILFWGKAKSSDVVIDEESTDWMWVDLADVDTLPMAESQRKRFNDVKEFFGN